MKYKTQIEDEPFPGERWEEGCYEWLTRFEYMEARIEKYFDHLREDPNYDLKRSGGDVNRQQKATALAIENYAAGKLTAVGVHCQVKMLREAYHV